MNVRRLSAAQQAFAEKAMLLTRVVIASYLKRNPDLIDVANRCDLDGTAEQAVCLAALTYNPEKAGISAEWGGCREPPDRVTQDCEQPREPGGARPGAQRTGWREAASRTKPLARASRFVRVGARFVRAWRGSGGAA